MAKDIFKAIPEIASALEDVENGGPWKVVELGPYGKGLLVKNLTKREAMVIAAALNNDRREQEADIPF